MKPLKGIEDWTGQKDPEFRPSKGILVFSIIAAIAVAVALVISSCANLQSIPFSVSYENEDGQTFSVTTEIPIHHKIHADK